MTLFLAAVIVRCYQAPSYTNCSTHSMSSSSSRILPLDVVAEDHYFCLGPVYLSPICSPSLLRVQASLQSFTITVLQQIDVVSKSRLSKKFSVHIYPCLSSCVASITLSKYVMNISGDSGSLACPNFLPDPPARLLTNFTAAMKMRHILYI